MKYMKTLLVAVFVVSTLTMTGCVLVHEHKHHGYGPPPHAPAHGYRHKHHNHDLVYDSGLGVYLVVGVPDFYFIDGFYYRYGSDGWYCSREFDKGWKPYKDYDKLPPGLGKKYQGRGHGKDRKGDQDHGGRDGKHGRGHGRD